MKKCFLGMFLLFQVMLTDAQVTASATLDSTRILIGDQLFLHIEATLLGDTKLYEATFRDSFASIPVEVLEESSWATLSENPKKVKKTLKITSFDSGTFVLPPLLLPYTTNGRRDTAFTNPNQLFVLTIPQDSLGLLDIKPIYKEALLLSDWIYYLVIPMGIILLVLVVFFIIKKSKKKAAPIEIAPPVIPAHVIAFNKLDSLKGKSLWQAGKLQAYYDELTYIIREYLENRYDIQALESTTSEISQALEKHNFDEGLQKQVRELLQTADLVKFAKGKPEAKLHEGFWEAAKGFIIKTKTNLEDAAQ